MNHHFETRLAYLCIDTEMRFGSLCASHIACTAVYKYELLCNYILLYKYANMHCNTLEKAINIVFSKSNAGAPQCPTVGAQERASAGSPTAGATARAPVEIGICRRSWAGAPAVADLPPAHRSEHRQ
jgi:hypothetical protein